MLASIHPLGERSKGNRWGITATAHVAGSVLGGAAVGLAAGLLGVLVHPVPAVLRAGLVAVLAVVAFAVDRRRSVRLPPLRQVDETWLTTYRGWVYGVGFGVQLGAGLATIVTAASIYLLFAALVLAGSPALGLVIGAWFGLARGATLLAAAGAVTPSDLHRLHRGLAARAGWGRTATVAADALVGMVAVAVAVGTGR